MSATYGKASASGLNWTLYEYCGLDRRKSGLLIWENRCENRRDMADLFPDGDGLVIEVFGTVSVSNHVSILY